MSTTKFNGKVPDAERFVMRFTNGVHIIFDRREFCVAETFRTRKEMVEKFNAPVRGSKQALVKRPAA